MKIQETIAAFLASQGQHKEAEEVLASNSRGTWVRLGDHAIRTAPETNRTHVAHVIQLALDTPENGGAGMACDFVIKAEAHPVQAGVIQYRAWLVKVQGTRELHDAGLVAPEVATLERRIVGLYIARRIIKPVTNNFLVQAENAQALITADLELARKLGAIPELLDLGVVEFPGTPKEQMLKLVQLLGKKQ